MGKSYNLFVRETDIEAIIQSMPPLQPVPTGRESDLTSGLLARAVLFDIYGTLLISGSGDVGSADSNASIEALGRVLERRGISLELSDNPLLQAIRDDHEQRDPTAFPHPEVDIREIWTLVLDAASDKPTEHDIELMALEYECSANPVAAMPDAGPLLQRCLEARIPVGIVSNAQFYTKLVLEAFFPGLLEVLDPGLLSWSYEHRRAKPDPRLFDPALTHLADHYEIYPAEVLYVGNDMRNDILTASKRGCKTALFAGDARSLRLREDVPEIRAVQADITLGGFRDMMALIHPGEIRYP